MQEQVRNRYLAKMGGVKHNRPTLATTSKRLKRLQDELLQEKIKSNTDEFEKGSRVVMTPAKQRLVARANQRGMRTRQKIMRPDRSIRQFQVIAAGLKKTQTNAQRMWSEEHKNFTELPDVYKPINDLGHTTQLGLVQQSIANYEKSRARFASGQQQIGKLAAQLLTGV